MHRPVIGRRAAPARSFTAALAVALVLTAACTSAPAAAPTVTSAPKPAAPTTAPAAPAAAPTTAPASAPTAAAAAKPTTPPAAAPAPTTAPAAAATTAPAPKPAAAAAPAGPLTKIVVSYPEGGAHLPLFLARDKGIFAKHGLEVELQGLGGGPVAAAALISGEIQIADITGSEIVNANANGAEMLVLATLTPVYPYVFEVSQDIKTKADLKGQTIAIRAVGDATDIATRVTLLKEGIDPDKDVKLLAVMQEGARMASLLSGQICCTVAQVQDRLTLEQSGFHMLFDLTSLGLPNAQGVIATPRTYAAANPQIVQGFINALVESIALMKADRAGALPVLKAQLKLEDDAIVAATYDFFATEVVPNVPLPKPEQFADGIIVLSARNEKVKGFDVSKFIDASYVQKAVALGLDKKP